jgi:peptidoglycan/LPS O-acetylase OafA/YrhL
MRIITWSGLRVRETGRATSAGRLPQLDGIRGIAILLVIFHNETSRYPFLHLDRIFANGWMGVDLFFVLSGLLITGILLDTKQSVGYFRNFYARRCLRIWPLYYSSLLFMFGIIPLLSPAEGKAIFERSSPWWAFPLYVQNFLVRVPELAPGLLGVTWSLAIEEQFYLVWPLIVRFCSTRLLRWIAVSVICLSPALRLFLSAAGVDIYANTFSRLDGLMAGALLAIVIRSTDFVPSRHLGKAWMALCIAAPLVFLTEAVDARWIVFSMSAAASVSLIYLALCSGQPWLQGVLRNRFLVYTGTISYGLYLLHKIPFNVGTALHLNQHPLLAAPILLAATYGMAALSWTLLERPFLNLKRFFATNSSRLRNADLQFVGEGSRHADNIGRLT